jgi:hypothetical protein
VNDGSAESSATLCQSYAERDSRFRHFEKENRGLMHEIMVFKDQMGSI